MTYQGAWGRARQLPNMCQTDDLSIGISQDLYLDRSHVRSSNSLRAEGGPTIDITTHEPGKAKVELAGTVMRPMDATIERW